MRPKILFFPRCAGWMLYIVQQNCCCFLYLHHTFRHLIPDHQTIYGRFPVFSSPGQLQHKQSPYECKPSHASQHTSVGAHLWCLNTQWTIEEKYLENSFFPYRSFCLIWRHFKELNELMLYVLKSGFQNTLEPIKPVSTICIVVILFSTFELNPIPTGQGYFYHHVTKPGANRDRLLFSNHLKKQRWLLH